MPSAKKSFSLSTMKFIHYGGCCCWFMGLKHFLCTIWHNWRAPTSRHLSLNLIEDSRFFYLREEKIFHRCRNHFTEFDSTWHNNPSLVTGKFNDPIYHSCQSIFCGAVMGKILKNTQPITSWFFSSNPCCFLLKRIQSKSGFERFLHLLISFWFFFSSRCSFNRCWLSRERLTKVLLKSICNFNWHRMKFFRFAVKVKHCNGKVLSWQQCLRL